MGGQKLCPQCSKELEVAFARIRKYMYSTNESVTAARIVEDLDIPEKIVNYLIEEKRLVLSPHTSSGSRCKVCGAPTDGKALCSKCQASFNADMQKFRAETEGNQPKRSDHHFGSVNPMYRSKED
jgi:hypothetical protein